MLDFRINTFLTVCQTMNFTKAAEELHITQPTVSQHIHYLEDYYETSLFTYQNRQLALTDTGKILQERLLRMKNDETTIQKELHENNERIKMLSIGVTMTIGEYAISGALAGYLKANPDQYSPALWQYQTASATFGQWPDQLCPCRRVLSKRILRPQKIYYGRLYRRLCLLPYLPMRHPASPERPSCGTASCARRGVRHAQYLGAESFPKRPVYF